MTKIIILNGAPGCGKDTIALELWDRCIVDTRESFKEPMFNIVKSMMTGQQYYDFLVRYSDRELKEKVWHVIGITPRQLMIHVSENFVKPIFGKDHFGWLAADIWRVSVGDVVVSDGGFPDEVRALASSGDNEIHIVRLHRNGFTFEGDSRNFISLDGEFDNVHEHDVVLTDGDIEGAVLAVCQAAGLEIPESDE